MVSVEWITNDVAILRTGPCHRTFGDPWTLVATAVVRGKDVYIHALAGEGMSRDLLREITAFFKKKGLRLRAKRAKGGVWREMMISGVHG